MRVFGLGMPELVVILLVVLLLFGPKNLPKLGASLGKTVKNLREGMGTKEEKAEVVEETEAAKPSKPAPKSAAKKEDDE